MIPAYCLFAVVGRPFANTIRMILIIIQMKVFSEKRRELSQSIALLSGSHDFCQSIDSVFSGCDGKDLTALSP